MANISDVYNIKFYTSSQKITDALYKYIVECEKLAPFYNLAGEPVKVDYGINSDYASGRWCYYENLLGYFQYPEKWLQNFGDIKKHWLKLKDLLVNGEKIIVNFTEQEEGCEIYRNGTVNISWFEDKVDLVNKYEELEFNICRECETSLVNNARKIGMCEKCNEG